MNAHLLYFIFCHFGKACQAKRSANVFLANSPVCFYITKLAHEWKTSNKSASGQNCWLSFFCAGQASVDKKTPDAFNMDKFSVSCVMCLVGTQTIRHNMVVCLSLLLSLSVNADVTWNPATRLTDFIADFGARELLLKELPTVAESKFRGQITRYRGRQNQDVPEWRKHKKSCFSSRRGSCFPVAESEKRHWLAEKISINRQWKENEYMYTRAQKTVLLRKIPKA